MTEHDPTAEERDEPLELPRSDEAMNFPCRSCGATLTYRPGAGALACEYCGYTEDIRPAERDIVEHAFDDWKTSGATGWGAERVDYHCDTCGANTSMEPHITAFRCAFCGSDKVVRRQDTAPLSRPESLVPFQIDAAAGNRAFQQWLDGLWFRPNALKKLARPGALQGVYLPFWTYDALTSSTWRAESGTYYYVTVSYTDSEGRRRSRQERRVRWRWVSGHHEAYFDDIQEVASPSVSRDLLDGVAPFDTGELTPYDPKYLSGFAAEDYRDDVVACWPRARQQMDDRIRSAIARRIPGDTYRNLSVSTSYHNRTFKLTLLPVWSGAYDYAGKTWSYVVNGQSGRVAGEAPLSWVKIAVATLAALALGAGVYLAVQ